MFGKLDAQKATEAEVRGQELFFGKAQCVACHVPPYYTDNLMHNLRTERFYKPRMINGHMASADGPIKTFPLRGIKDSPPYLHDDRLLSSGRFLPSARLPRLPTSIWPPSNGY